MLWPTFVPTTEAGGTNPGRSRTSSRTSSSRLLFPAAVRGHSGRSTHPSAVLRPPRASRTYLRLGTGCSWMGRVSWRGLVCAESAGKWRMWSKVSPATRPVVGSPSRADGAAACPPLSLDPRTSLLRLLPFSLCGRHACHRCSLTHEEQRRRRRQLITSAESCGDNGPVGWNHLSPDGLFGPDIITHSLTCQPDSLPSQFLLLKMFN